MKKVVVFVRWVWGVVKFLPKWALSKIRRKHPQFFRASRVDDFPDSLKTWTVYVAGEDGHLWAAALVCPCGCGETVELNLLKQVRPCWSVEEHPDGSITLMPSVWRQKGCRSHFFVRHGHIDWC